MERRDLLETEISNFMVIELKAINGCAALIRCVRSPARPPALPSTRLPESKFGGRLLSELERKAEQQNHTYVYVDDGRLTLFLKMALSSLA